MSRRGRSSGGGVDIAGTFGSYALAGDGLYPDDEEAIYDACQNMLSMCGNPGQEVLIGDQLDNFEDWALEILEDESASTGSTWESFKAMVIEDWYDGRVDKFMGTDYIWGAGWLDIANQSGFHDSKDEYGEGTGNEFAS